MHFGLAAAVAAAMIGGVAVAAGTGALPTPFDEPGPAASVSAAVTPHKPLLTPTPDGAATGGSISPTPEDTNGTPGQGTSSRDEAGAGSTATGRSRSPRPRRGPEPGVVERRALLLPRHGRRQRTGRAAAAQS
ncbi:hypothetical protein ACFQ0G_21695 [Streptomyces chiangmaiensis]